MENLQVNKKKIINDPVSGFISIQSDLIFDLIEHPYFQRLRRIKQLGLSHLVFPGANHTRFEHTLGALHLIRQSIEVLRLKGNEIPENEADAVAAAILLHDLGHGPFSHVLENTLVKVSHEDMSLFFMNELNRQFDGKLGLAIKIFRNEYPKKFLHQLVSSQLDMDRLDYLRRDSFFTGVTEGMVGSDRIIKMLDIKNDMLVVEAKGIYSVEKFLIARRLMYWQVYLHKTVVAAEYMLVNILKRARELAASGETLFAAPALKILLENNFEQADFEKNRVFNNQPVLDLFASLDDSDIMLSVKEWQNHPDKILSFLAKGLVNRRLYKIRFREKPISQKKTESIKQQIIQRFSVSEQETGYFFIAGELENSAYNNENENIRILFKGGKTKDFKNASDINLSVLTTTVRKFFLCFPKELDIN